MKRRDALPMVQSWIERATYPWPIVYGMAWFAEEYHRDGERLHLHGLLYLDAVTSWERLARAWRKTGRCKIERYDPRRGAVDYCAKYVSKDAVNVGEWRLFEWSEGQRV